MNYLVVKKGENGMLAFLGLLELVLMICGVLWIRDFLKRFKAGAEEVERDLTPVEKDLTPEEKEIKEQKELQENLKEAIEEFL